MWPRNNTATCLVFVQKVYNEGRLELIEDFVDQNAINHELEGYALPYLTTPQLTAEFLHLYRTAFPDFHVRVEEILSDGDRVITRWRMQGTQTGPLMGIDPTGQPIDVRGIRIDRFANGKIVETWGNWDSLGMLEQIGALPEMRRTVFPSVRISKVA
jgi:predicted ester cyclase